MDPISINGKNYILESSLNSSFISGFSKYSGSSKGIYQTFSFAQKVFEAGVYFPEKFLLSKERIKDLEVVSQWLSSAKELLIIPKISSYTLMGLGKSFFNWCKSTDKTASESRSALLYKGIEVISDSNYLLQLFRFSAIQKLFFQRVGSVANFVLSSWDLKKLLIEEKSFIDLLYKTNPSNDFSNKALKIVSREKWNLFMLKIVFKVTEIAQSILLFIGFLHLVTPVTFLSGSVFLSSLTFWGVEAVSCAIGFGADVYEGSMTYKLEERVSKEEPPAA